MGARQGSTYRLSAYVRSAIFAVWRGRGRGARIACRRVRSTIFADLFVRKVILLFYRKTMSFKPKKKNGGHTYILPICLSTHCTGPRPPSSLSFSEEAFHLTGLQVSSKCGDKKVARYVGLALARPCMRRARPADRSLV